MAVLMKMAAEVQELLSTRQPVRIAVLVSSRSSFATEASKSSDAVIQGALSCLDVDASTVEPFYVANQIWDMINIFVFDLYNEHYDFSTAHTRQDLPVVIVNYSRRKKLVSLAPKGRRDEVNDAVAKLHDMNGWEKKPPFVEDHTQGRIPSYSKPRCMTYYSPELDAVEGSGTSDQAIPPSKSA